jgi:hypothetical protein
MSHAISLSCKLRAAGRAIGCDLLLTAAHELERLDAIERRWQATRPAAVEPPAFDVVGPQPSDGMRLGHAI